MSITTPSPQMLSISSYWPCTEMEGKTDIPCFSLHIAWIGMFHGCYTEQNDAMVTLYTSIWEVPSSISAPLACMKVIVSPSRRTLEQYLQIEFSPLLPHLNPLNIDDRLLLTFGFNISTTVETVSLNKVRWTETCSRVIV
jgi:hypothetical protein